MKQLSSRAYEMLTDIGSHYGGPRNSYALESVLALKMNSWYFTRLTQTEKEIITLALRFEFAVYRWCSGDGLFTHEVIMAMAEYIHDRLKTTPSARSNILYKVVDVCKEISDNSATIDQSWSDTTDYSIEHGYFIDYKMGQERSASRGTDTMLGTDYISSRNAYRKWRHMREMLIHAWDITNTPSYVRFERDIDTKFSRDNDTLARYLTENFSVSTINEAHDRAKSNYKGRGRPRFSRNLDKINNNNTANDTALDNLIEDNSSATDSNDNANSTTEMLDSSKFVLKTDHNRNIADINTDLRTLKADSSFATRNIKEISEHVHELSDKVKHLEESRINTITITPIDTTLPPIELGAQHKHFETLLAMCMARTPDASHLNIWLYGPAGTGKTTAAKNVAKALQRKFYSMGALETGYQILGYTGADGRTYKRTHFRECWEHGGVIALDECDSYTPSAALALNGALANGFCSFDDKLVERHPDCIIIAGANTTGLGGTMEYVGRMKHDAAFLDRFVMLDWPIDEALEAHLCDNHDWLKRVRHVRANIINKQVKGAMVTPRATIYGAALLRAGVAWDVVERTTLKKGMTDAQWQQVK